MKISLLWVLGLLLICMPLAAYQNASFSLFTPSSLEKGEGEISIAHRFYGAIDEDSWDTLLGINQGANVGLRVSYNLPYSAFADIQYTRQKSQTAVAAGWQIPSADMPVAISSKVTWVSFLQPGISDRKNSMQYLVGMQNKAFSQKVTLSVNAGYDAYYDRFVNGFGILIPIRENVAILGEYYPVWDRNSAAEIQQQYLGRDDSFGVGLKLSTWGHQFMFQLSNSTASNPANMAMGTDDSSLKLGFNIHRRF